MTTIKKNKISDSEWEIMRVVWTKGKVTSQEVIDALGDKLDWKPATIKSLLNRLVKKEALATEQFGKKYIYSPIISEEASVKSATESLFMHICSTKIGSTIAELIDEATLTHEDVALIQAAIEKKTADAVDVIECDCIPGQCECKEHQLAEKNKATISKKVHA